MDGTTDQDAAPRDEGLASQQAVAQVVAEVVAQSVGVLPDELAVLPSIHVSGAALDLLELLLGGVLQGGFTLPGQVPAVLQVALPVPGALAGTVVPGTKAVLEDAEGVPVALVDVTETAPVPGSAEGEGGDLLASGSVTGLRPLTHGPFRRLRLTPDELAALPHPPALTVTTNRPLIDDDVAAVVREAAGAPVLVLALVGTGRSPYPGPFGLVRALRSTLPLLPDDSLVVPVPLPLTGGGGAGDLVLRETLARGYGAERTLHLTAATRAELDWLVEQDAGVPGAALEVLRAHRPDRAHRGVVLFFTGLSGSGKSTLAQGVAEALQESTDRTVTLLDGDVVRRHLSKGLGFSRADRDTNIRRIGFVAAEVARHGGVALCAPIAPYEATRAAVRAMVEDAGGEFVLVHVSTPLEVCEARDRKGLYAQARAGTLPEFTGVSDPYETPTDADLSVDTSTVDVSTAVELVLAELRGRGFAPTAHGEDA